MHLAFEHLDLEIVAVTHHRENEQSQRAIEEYIEAHGGQRDGIIQNGLSYQDGTVVDEVRYTVSEKEYAESTSSWRIDRT